MKILTLLRHAKSGWDDPVKRDFDRPLNPRGRRAARTVGREMRSLGLTHNSLAGIDRLRWRVWPLPSSRRLEPLEALGEAFAVRPVLLTPRFA